MCSENRLQEELGNTKSVIGRGPDNNNNNNNNNPRRLGGVGVRKEEIQQGRTNTLVRTVKETHNLMLREKVRKRDGGSKRYLCSDNRFSENESAISN